MYRLTIKCTDGSNYCNPNCPLAYDNPITGTYTCGLGGMTQNSIITITVKNNTNKTLEVKEK